MRMDEKIQISIVVPIYNIQDYLERCIESILNQSYKNVEVILVDDGSTDKCPEICDNYSKKDNRINVIHKKNGGLVSARKAGTAIAKGDYILNVDGDDWIEKERIEVLVNEGILPDRADMIYMSGHKKDFGKDSIAVDYEIPIGTFYRDEIEKRIWPLLFDEKEVFRARISDSLWTWAIKRELLQEKQKLINDELITGEDIICCWFCLVGADSVTLIKQSGYHYIQRESSLSYKAVSSSIDNGARIKIWYHQFIDYLNENKVSNNIYKLFVGVVIRTLMQSNYELLLDQKAEYLYPFSKILSGSKIIVYGAGKIGYSLMSYLSKTKKYQVVLWVDRNKQRLTLPGYEIASVEDILKKDFDYIAVAVQNVDIAKKIEELLIHKGVAQSKIALMDANVVREEAIPDEITMENI